MKPHYQVSTGDRKLIIKCDSAGEARKVANTMLETMPIIEYVRNIGSLTVSSPVSVELP